MIKARPGHDLAHRDRTHTMSSRQSRGSRMMPIAPSKCQPSPRDDTLKHPYTRTRSRKAHAKPAPTRTSLRLASRQNRVQMPGNRHVKPGQSKSDPLKEWPAVAILGHRFVELNRRSKKEYLIEWERGEKGELFKPTWQPCENANEALRAEYENKTTEKKGVNRATNTEKGESAKSIVFESAGGDTSEVHRTDWFSFYVSDADAHTPWTAQEPQDTTRGSVAKLTEEATPAGPRVTVASLLRSPESELPKAPRVARVQDVEPIPTKDDSVGHNVLTKAPAVIRESLVRAQTGVHSRSKGKLPLIKRRYGRKSRSEDVFAVPLSP